MRSETAMRPVPQVELESLGETGPVTCLALHPTDTSVLYLSGQTLVGYDYSSRRTTLRRSLKEILAAQAERAVPSLTGQTVFGPGDPLGPRLPKHCRGHSERPFESRRPRGSVFSVVSNVGAVKAVQFSDFTWLQSQWIGKRIKYFPLNTIHSESLVTIICEVGVIFYDTKKHRSRVVSHNDLEKTNPSSVEFIHLDFCAIGCSDGCIRIFDTSHLKCTKVLNTHSKISKSNEVCIMKSLPEEHMDHLNSSLIRFVSMSHDSIGYIWYGIVALESLDIGEPSAIIKNPKKDTVLSGSSSFPVSVSFDSVTSMLYATYSNHKIRVWDLTVLPYLQSSRPSSVRTTSSQQLAGTPKRKSLSNLSLMSTPSARKLFGSASPASSTTNGILPVPCAAILKPKASLDLGKISSCTVIKNPYLYPGRMAFAFTNRTEHIFLAVSVPTGKSGEELPSETASAHSGESPIAEGVRDLILLETLSVNNQVLRRLLLSTSFSSI